MQCVPTHRSHLKQHGTAKLTQTPKTKCQIAHINGKADISHLHQVRNSPKKIAIPLLADTTNDLTAVATVINPSENKVALDVTELVQSGATAFLLKAQDELGGVSDVEFHTADGSPQAPFLHITVPAIPPIVWPSKGCQDRYETVSWYFVTHLYTPRPRTVVKGSGGGGRCG